MLMNNADIQIIQYTEMMFKHLKENSTLNKKSTNILQYNCMVATEALNYQKAFSNIYLLNEIV